MIGDAGLTKAQLQAAFGIDNSIDISTFNALADAINKGASGPGLAVLKVAPCAEVQYVEQPHQFVSEPEAQSILPTSFNEFTQSSMHVLHTGITCSFLLALAHPGPDNALPCLACGQYVCPTCSTS